MNQIMVVIVLALATGAALLFRHISPAKSRLVIGEEKIHFPEVSGYNLERKEIEFPKDFQGDQNLVIVAFQQQHQEIVNTWIPFLQILEEENPGFVYYELPTIKEMSALSRTFINEGMRAGIPDQTARERTVTLYIDKEKFKSAVNIPDEKDIQIFLVDKEGSIAWRTEGAYTKDKFAELLELLK